MDFNEKHKLHEDQYYPQIFEKDQIYLHHTVGGSAISTIGWWNTSKIHVGTAFVVERNGTIYRVFDERMWAYHLGLKTNFNQQSNKRSIGIEIASEGALKSGSELNAVLVREGVKPRMRDDVLYAFDILPNRKKPPTAWFERAKPLYNVLHDEGLFIDTINGYRGYRYFDEYDNPQIIAVFELVKYLCKEHNIPTKTIGGDFARFDIALATEFKGVLSHANVRLDKSDVHPIFPWYELTEFIGG